MTCFRREAARISGMVRSSHEGYGKIKNAALRVRETPFFFIPYFIFPAKNQRQTGFLPPGLGYSSRNGAEIEVPFFWAISDQADATFYERFMSERGFMQGLEARYVAEEDSKGIFLFDVLSDKVESKDLGDPDQASLSPFARTNQTRYWLRGRMDQALPLDVAARFDADYVSDQADVEWSVPFLADFLIQLGDRLGVSNVKVLAHSLGSRGVLFALQRLRAETDRRPVMGPLVLIAPDFDSQTFVDKLPEITPLVEGVTLYASENDTPLKASRKLSGYPRLGEAGDFLTVLEGMETIDVSPAGRYQILGHEYFYFHPRVTADLVALLVYGKPASERPGLRKRNRQGIPYWEIE